MSNESYIVHTANKYSIRIDFGSGIIQWGKINEHIIIKFFDVGDVKSLAEMLRQTVNEIEDYRFMESLT